ncbi:hypothetical protein [Actinomadura sp. 6K520]|uniref:hypothetical protein n=1 Tax=Actinomadura sp. 6K520 TaxID=2530364 RepID=UPI0010470688|nr:hypothetical protein [Actinomadura sp. 6K520]TDE29019.1 hypothetical protein E1289_20905 [Actinomadura sp. 6K520]
MEPLGYTDAVRLLGTRAIGLPEPFVALFHCLSGGMPRDLLRTARAAVSQTSPERPRTLAETAAYLVGRDLDRGLDEVAPESHALFRDTLLHVFGEALTHEQMDLATDPDFPGSFDALAAVQRGLTDAGANVTVDIGTIRQAWGLPVAGAPNGTARSGTSSAPRP